MKKRVIVTGVIAGLISGAAFAQTNVVSSANVVGYISVINPASNKYTIVAAPFISGTGTVSTLVDVFGTNQLRQNNIAVRADTVQKWNKATQKYLSYYQKTNGLFYATTNTTVAVNPEVTRGEALWIIAPSTNYAPTPKIIYISGDVPNDAAYTNSIAGGSVRPFNFMANPYPVEMSLNDLISTNDGAKANSVFTRADQLQLWDIDTQKYVTYGLKASTNAAINGKWLLSTAFSTNIPPVVLLNPGQGFWYTSTNSFTWIEQKAYTLE